FTASYGGGHNSVARALAEHLKSHYKNVRPVRSVAINSALRKSVPKDTSNGVNVDVVDFMARFAAGDRLMCILYKQSAKRLPAAYSLFFKLTDRLFEKPLWKKVLTPALNQVRQFLLAAQPDIVVSVYPTAGIVASRLSKELGFKTATIITDFGAHSQWIDKNTDSYFVPTDNLKNFLIAKGIKPNRIKVTGIPIRDIFSSTPAISTIRRKARRLRQE
ncbi:MAG: hypothetical protein HY762_04315, partial [Planctomycetes bacterium]|nr:hypothetical protein [Planctomycetota bacterium]